MTNGLRSKRTLEGLKVEVDNVPGIVEERTKSSVKKMGSEARGRALSSTETSTTCIGILSSKRARGNRIDKREGW